MRISIVTPTLNSEKTMLQCINSINNQTIKNIEHVIVDGVSTDNTLEIIRKNSNANLKVISEKDKGIYDAMNKGIRYSTGDIIGILNSDDRYADIKILKKVKDAFETNKCDIVYGDINIVKNNTVLRYWRAGKFEKGSFFKGWHPPHPAFFVTKKVYEKYGYFRTDMSLAADFEFMLRVLEKETLKFEYLNEVVVNMSFGGATTGSIRNIVNGNRQCVRAFNVNGFRPPHFYSILRYLPKIKQFISRSR